MKNIFTSEEDALRVVKPYADIEDNVIYPHDVPAFNRFFDRNMFWDAMEYLQTEYDYENGNNKPLIDLNFDDL